MFSFVDSRIVMLLAAIQVILVALVKCHGEYMEEPGSCVQYGQMYSDKDVWKPQRCRICACETGRIFCNIITCKKMRYCPYPKIPFGGCCPICPTD